MGLFVDMCLDSWISSCGGIEVAGLVVKVGGGAPCVVKGSACLVAE